MATLSKTPLFDKALEQHWSQERPSSFTCRETGEAWTLSFEEQELYRSLHLPIPSLGPKARLRRLTASVGGFDLFRRGEKGVISMYDPESPAELISHQEWHGDQFDALAYGCDYEADRSFFEQWTILSQRVPRPYIIQDPTNENSPWGLYDLFAKNAYFTYGNLECEDILYSDISAFCKKVVDCTASARLESCYETIQSFDANRLLFCERCDSSIDLLFCLGCRDCHDCFGCTNLNKKSFCWLNEQLTEEEYKRRRANVDLRDHQQIQHWKQAIQPLWNKAVRCAGRNYQSEDSLGDDLMSCQKVKGISVLNGQRLYNVFIANNSKDSVDLFTCNSLERCANTIYNVKGYENKMSSTCVDCLDIEYCELMTSCEHCFGCIGLKHKKFCIFNKQYSEEEYWLLVDQIKTNMLMEGEYGEYFPYGSSLFAYNTSHADAAFPLEKGAVQSLRARWYGFEQEQSTQAEPIENLPERLDPTNKTVDTHFYRCPTSGRPFRFVQPEWDFHQEMDLALPRLHPTIRRKQRFEQLGPLSLLERTCDRCQQMVHARYPKSHPAPLYCGACYEKYVMLEEG